MLGVAAIVPVPDADADADADTDPFASIELALDAVVVEGGLANIAGSRMLPAALLMLELLPILSSRLHVPPPAESELGPRAVFWPLLLMMVGCDVVEEDAADAAALLCLAPSSSSSTPSLPFSSSSSSCTSPFPLPLPLPLLLSAVE
jgi:hypothetical protein